MRAIFVFEFSVVIFSNQFLSFIFCSIFIVERGNIFEVEWFLIGWPLRCGDLAQNRSDRHKVIEIQKLNIRSRL